MQLESRFGAWRCLLLLGATAVGCSGENGPGGVAASGDYRVEPPGVLKATVQSRELSPSVDGRDLTALVTGNTELALSLFEQLREQAPSENMALGPYSISQAMAMLYAGARGETAEEMRQVLHFTVDSAALHPTFNGLDLELASRNSDIVLRNANQAWLATGFEANPEYLDVLTRDYGAPLVALDFASDAEAARGVINQWVSDVTEEKIPTLFPVGTIPGNTVLVLTNAMYMDAPWKYQFDPASTRAAPFTLGDGSSVMVDTMHYDEFLPSASGDGWQAVELPYRGDEVSMFVVVPDDLEQFEAALTSELLDSILGEIRDGGIHLSFPRFSYRFHASLIEPFEALGLSSLFSAPDLSGIAGGLAVAAIEHEAFVEVDEEGTRAAAATGVAVVDSHGPSISVDRPFLFFIVDKPTGSVLFLGRVLDPR
jgi:serpin B